MLMAKWGGPLGHLTWPLDPQKSFCIFVICFVLFLLSFVCLLLIEKNLFPPPPKKTNKGHFWLLFSVSPSFSLVFFPHPFSRSLSLSLSSSILSSFLLFFLVLLSSGSLCFFLSLSFFFLFLCLSFMKEQHQHIKFKVLFHQSFLFWGFSVFLFLSNSFSLSLSFFLILSLFLIQYKCCFFQKSQFQKVSVSFSPCFAKFGLMFKKHCKIGISEHFQKQKKGKNDNFEGSLSGPSKGYYLGQVCCNIKMANLALIIALQFFARTVFSRSESAETPVL